MTAGMRGGAQGLHSVRSENLDGNTAAASMRRSKTAPRALPTLEEPLLLPEVSCLRLYRPRKFVCQCCSGGAGKVHVCIAMGCSC
jgi:hypothetical protein